MKDHLSMQCKETWQYSNFLVTAIDFVCVNYFLNLNQHCLSTEEWCLYHLFFRVPAGFAHTDDIKCKFMNIFDISFCCVERCRNELRCNVRGLCLVWGFIRALLFKNNSANSTVKVYMDWNKHIILLSLSCGSRENCVSWNPWEEENFTT